MKSIGFPKMLNATSTVLTTDREATVKNLMLLLASEQGEFLSDSDFGVRIRHYMFEQNNYVLKEIIIDSIYTAIAKFMPQLFVNRDDIEITQERGRLKAVIKALNRIDYTTNMYELVLFDEDIAER